MTHFSATHACLITDTIVVVLPQAFTDVVWSFSVLAWRMIAKLQVTCKERY